MSPRKKPLDRVRAFALSHPEAYEEETWGHPTFRVNKKIFAIGDDESMSCKGAHGSRRRVGPPDGAPSPSGPSHGATRSRALKELGLRRMLVS